MKHLAVILMLALVGCGDPSSTRSPASSAPSAATEADTIANRGSEQTQSAAVSSSGTRLDGDVAMTLDVTELPDQRVRLNGTTNLPAGTKLMLGVKEQLQDGFYGQSSCLVSSTGTFSSESFGAAGGLKPGRYVAEVTMPIPGVQANGVKQIIGKNGENLSGPLVVNGSLGVTVSQQKGFTIGGAMAAQAQEERAKRVEEATVKLKQQLCILLEQLMDFKDNPDFKQYGFGKGGKYNKWLTDVEALRDSQPKGMHPIPLLLRAAPGDLMTLGMEYMQKNEETNYTRQMLPEIEQTMGYAEYLKNKTSNRRTKSAVRTWNDSTGTFSVEASLVAVKDGNAVLEKKDGTTINVPLQKLSEGDLTFVKQSPTP